MVGERARSSPAFFLVAAGAAVWILFSGESTGTGFANLPQPQDLSRPADRREMTTTEPLPELGMDALQWLEASTKSDLALAGQNIRRALEEGLDGASEALRALDAAVAGAVLGVSTKPVLIDGALVPEREESLLEKVLQPLTKLFMQYTFRVRPRCNDCRIVRRWGRWWRVCHIRRHNARQPGMSWFRKRMARYRAWGRNKAGYGYR